MEYDAQFYILLMILSAITIQIIRYIGPHLPLILQKVCVLFALTGISVEIIGLCGFIYMMRIEHMRR